MAKLEFLKNNDTAPAYAIRIYPIGTRLQWRQPDRPITVHIIVTGYALCTDSSCNDCDKDRYIDEVQCQRCHFRRPDSKFGLCYWEIDNSL